MKLWGYPNSTRKSHSARIPLWHYFCFNCFLLHVYDLERPNVFFSELNLSPFFLFRVLLPLWMRRRSQFQELRNFQDLRSTYLRSRILKVNWSMSPKLNSSWKKKGERKTIFFVSKRPLEKWFMEALHRRSLEFQKCLLRIRTFKLDQYYRRKVFLVCKAKFLSLSYSQTSQRAIEDVCLPSPCWLPLGWGRVGLGEERCLGGGPWGAFDVRAQGALHHSMPQFPYPDAPKSDELLLSWRIRGARSWGGLVVTQVCVRQTKRTW